MLPKGKEVIFVGYSHCSKGYRLYDKQSRKIIEGCEVIFLQPTIQRNNFSADIESPGENSLSFEDNSIPTSIPTNNLAADELQVEDSQADVPVNNKVVDEDIAISLTNTDVPNTDAIDDKADVFECKTEKEPPIRYIAGRPKLIRSGRKSRPMKVRHVLNSMQSSSTVVVPNTFDEVADNKHAKEWKTAMQEEYHALLKNNTWTLTNLPNRQRHLGCKWVFSLKHRDDGGIEKFKCRLVAKECDKKYGVNYKDTFSPVVRYSTVCMLLALAVEEKLFVHHMDVCTAYLNGELNETVFMVQPQRFKNPKHPDEVLKFNKSIYGLKQAGRQWNAKLHEVLFKLGFLLCQNETCLYKRNNKVKLSLIAIYVDDLLIACSSMEDMKTIKTQIGNEFECVDRGQIRKFLGIRVERERELGPIAIHQSPYIKDLLSRHGMTDCRPATTPLDPGFVLECESDSCKRIDPTAYHSMIGELMYIGLCIRPDIMFSVSKLAQRNKCPHTEHEAKLKLHYKICSKDVGGYADADWGNNKIDRKSYSG